MIVKLHEIGLAQNDTKNYKVYSASGAVVTADTSGIEQVVFWAPQELIKKMRLLKTNLQEDSARFFIDDDGDLAVAFEEK